MASVVHRDRPKTDEVFREQYVEHIGRLKTCGCTIMIPSKDCDIGHALFLVAYRNGPPFSQRNIARRP
jgi:hypothetical protein